jgi:nucleoside-diphosphate-sugar epimerase
MKILIVGSNGFLGRTFMNQMKHLGHEIHQLNRSSVSSGFFDYANVKTILKENQFDCVISFAWITNLANYRNSAENEKYRDATINLAIESKMNSVPLFVGIGSAAEYGNQNLNCDSSSSSLIKSDAYSSAKIETFQELTRVFGKNEFIWARIFQPYGFGQDRNRFLPYLIDAQLTGKEAAIRNPNYTCDWISSDDIASGLIHLISNHLFGPYDIGTGIATANWELAELVGLPLPGGLDLSPSNGLVVSSESPILHSGWKPEKKLRAEITSMLKVGNS